MSKQADRLPQFSSVKINQIVATVEAILKNNRHQLVQLLDQQHFTWDNLVEPLSSMHDNLHQYWSIISHMNSVVNSAALRQAYNDCLPALSAYYTEMSHNHQLFVAIQSIANSDAFNHLNIEQQKVIKNQLRDFNLSGVSLPSQEKKQFASQVTELTQLKTKFEENLLDATNDWKKLITNKDQLNGIPESALIQAHERAKAEKKQGWMFTLEMPSYLAVMMHADCRRLREEAYRAYVTRASDQSPNGKQWDNSEIMQNILHKRHQLSHLLGFNNYAEESLATKMAKNPEEVIDFLNRLAKQACPKAKAEFEELSQFAHDSLDLETLAAWDVTYAAEKFRQHKYAISQEALRPYFAEEKVLQGLFTIIEKLFDIKINAVADFDSWHEDVKCYVLHSSDDKILSYCYVDLYARPNKRGGAWMDDCRGRRKRSDGSIQIPVAFVTCNFNSPTPNQPALFTHDEVITLFHEFGHALQHMLTKVDTLEVSGINGIPWDAVELPSQFLENWAWQKESLDLFAKHYKDNTPLPSELFDKLNNAKNFQSAMQMVRQLEFALFDFRLHLEFDPKRENQIQTLLDQVREQVSVVPTPMFNRFQHGFSHIFAGGYGAGYYSYKWAEVMASDAFSVFLEKGIFDKVTANKFLTYILEPGGSREPSELYKEYRGRAPNVEALLKQSGIIENN